MRYEFHPDALAEYRDAALFYAGCRTGLELRFIECVESAIKRILKSPSAWKILEEDVRHCSTPVFPYSGLYTIESDYILIIAVAHRRRKPGYWKYRYINHN
jgi:toxin ParE1/3/4